MSIFDLKEILITQEYLLDRGFYITYDEPHLKVFSLNIRVIVDDIKGKAHSFSCIVSYDESGWKVGHLPTFGGLKIDTIQDLNCWIESVKLKYKRLYKTYEKIRGKY